MEPKYGVVGCGHISQYYFQFLEASGASVVHLADLDIERANQCAKPFGAKTSTDYHDVVSDPEVSVVIVLAHARFHLEICLAAIRAGKDVICEKTLANGVAEAEEIALAAKEAGVLFFSPYMKRFFPAVQKAKELIGGLGVLFSAHARSYQVWGNLFEPAEDFSDQLWLNNYGGGVLKCAGSHILDLIMFLLGRPKSLYANTDFVESSKLDRKVVALLEYDGSLTVNFEATGHPLKKIGYERNGWDERIEINGTNGRLEIYTTTWNKPEECAALLVHYDNTTENAVEYRFDAINTLHSQMESFHNSLISRTQSGPSVIDGFNVDAIISAISDSGKQGKRIEIDWKGL